MSLEMHQWHDTLVFFGNSLDFKSEICHEETDLKVFVVVIQKEGWASVAMPILLLVCHRLIF